MQMLQDEREIAMCADTVRQLTPFAILEIGSAAGGTLAQWLRTGATHVVSIDADHNQLDRNALEQVRQPDQQLHLITGRSDDPTTIVQLDVLMARLGVTQFDVSYIDGAHTYSMVKLDFATCCPRTSKAVILNDPVMVDVAVFVGELSRIYPAWATASIVNPNRRLPCAGTHTCGSDYLAETGGGNYVLLLDERYRAVLENLRARIATELVPVEPDFQPTRSYFHRRGLARSTEYAAYWMGAYPTWGPARRWLFADAWACYERSRYAQALGDLEASRRLLQQARRARQRWHVGLLRRAVRPLLD